MVYCNCDDPENSNFLKYFVLNFEYLGLKKLIICCYKNKEQDLFFQENVESAVFFEYTGEKIDNKHSKEMEIFVVRNLLNF